MQIDGDSTLQKWVRRLREIFRLSSKPTILTHVDRDVGTLTNIGHVNGDVFITSNRSVGEGAATESVSTLDETLLRQIALRSLALHQSHFGIAGSERKVEITREAELRLADAVDRSYGSLIGVRGVSGVGKSTLVRQYGLKINDRGGICVWAPAEDLVRNVSPAALLLRILRRFHPALNERAGDDALDIAAKVPGGIVLLTDDINRLAAPHEALEAARVCVRALAQGRPPEGSPTRLCFIMPLWPEQLAGQSTGEKSDWEVLDLDFYSAQERSELARTHSSSRGADLLSLIDALNGDPFLCGLALGDLTDQGTDLRSAPQTLLSNIIEGVLGSAAREAAQTARVLAMPDEFVGALNQLIVLMLRKEQPEPAWSDVREELVRAELLLALAETNRLGWVEQRTEGSRWRWKHDRLRDALVGRWLAMSVGQRLSRTGPREEDVRLLSMPGLAEAWAWSLAFATPDQCLVIVTALAEHNPLALANSLTIARLPEGDAARRIVVDGLRRALDGFNPSQETFVTPPQWPVLHRLAMTDQPIVLEVTEHMERNWYVALARFRNGDTQAGLRLLRRERMWPPAVSFPMLERAVEGYARVSVSSRAQVAGEFRQAISDAENIVAVQTLCGYLGWTELAQIVWDSWASLDGAGQQATLVPLVWALGRCADETMQDKLEDAILRARALSDEELVEGNIHHASDRHDHFVEPLRFALRWDMTTESTGTWARVAREQEDMRDTFLHLLREMDQPLTIEAYVRLTSTFGGSWIDALEAQRHPGDGDDALRERVPVSAVTRAQLWQIVEGDEPTDTRKVAFWLWKRFPRPGDVERLRGIAKDDPLFNEAFKVRLRLRDRTAAPGLIELMNADPGVWCSYAYAIYHEEGVADALFNNLEFALASGPVERQYVERLPQYLPPEGVRRLVREKRELLIRSRRMWLPLWRSDVPEALELLQQALQVNSEELRHARWMSVTSYPVSERMLNAILPLIHLFSAMDQDQLAFLILHAGRTEWAEAHGVRGVRSSLNGAVTLWLSEDGAIKTLNEAARAVPQGVQQVERTEWFYELRTWDKRVSFDPRVVVKQWLSDSLEPDKLIVAAMLLSSFGTEEDLEWWQGLEPGGVGNYYEAWSNTLYVLRRRRWQQRDSAE